MLSINGIFNTFIDSIFRREVAGSAITADHCRYVEISAGFEAVIEN
jgi:hypothetical protein